MARRIGWLVPEFPGQTHGMFWRELGELRDRGVVVDVVTTRPPASSGRFSDYDWRAAAVKESTALAEPGPRALLSALRGLLRAGPTGWWRVLTDLLASRRGVRRLPALIGAVGAGAHLATLGRERGWQHVHVHSCATSADIARFSRALGGPSYSLTLHGPVGDYGPDQRLKWREAAFGIAITEEVLAGLRATVGVDLPAVVVCGMSPAAGFRRSAAYEPWTPPGDALLFACGRLNPAKGYDDLLAAIALLRRRGSPVTLVVAGEDDDGGRGYRREVESMILNRGLDVSVRLLGAVTSDEVRTWLQRAHLFVLPSKAEPLGVALMEAMAMGLPVVATRAGGVPTLVTHGEDGMLAEPSDPASLALMIDAVLSSPALACALGQAAEVREERRGSGISSAGVLVGFLDT